MGRETGSCELLCQSNSKAPLASRSRSSCQALLLVTCRGQVVQLSASSERCCQRLFCSALVYVVTFARRCSSLTVCQGGQACNLCHSLNEHACITILQQHVLLEEQAQGQWKLLRAAASRFLL